MTNTSITEHQRIAAIISGTPRSCVNAGFYPTWKSIVDQFEATGSLSNAQIDILIRTNQIAAITQAKRRAARNYDFNATANRIYNPTKPRN